MGSYDVLFAKEPTCEHCGSLKTYEVTILDGDIWWCFQCALTLDLVEGFEEDIFDELTEKMKEVTYAPR